MPVNGQRIPSEEVEQAVIEQLLSLLILTTEDIESTEYFYTFTLWPLCVLCG